MDINRMALTRCEHKLGMAVAALRQIATVDVRIYDYHMIVDRQIERAKEALEDMGYEPKRIQGEGH